MLEQYRWKNRVLVIFSENPQTIQTQKKQLDKQTPELTERKLILLGFNETKTPYKNHDTTQLRQNHPNPKETIALYGLDGGLKESWPAPVDLRKIFAAIDKMPMRQRELRENQENQ